jgi:cyanophycin synthetase
MVAIAERVPAHVVGDGSSTVAELVELTNADPRRGVGHEKVLTRIRVDEAAVELVRAQGFELEDVPPEGTTVKLTLTGNMSTGGISIDRTDEAHPDNVEIAEEAARVVGLDVAGIDFIAPDLAEPVRETGGAIVEVNAAPGSACTPTRPWASPSTWPSRWWTSCSRPAPPRGSRSWP